MKEALQFLENLTTVAFLVLGVATAVSWLRHRANSLGFLALAIVLLSIVTILSRISGDTPPRLLSDISVAGFMASGYAMVRYRSSLIPLRRRVHAAVALALLTATVSYLVISSLVDSGLASAGLTAPTALLLVAVWSAAVGEVIVRFWLVARDLPAVQAWRLRSLSLGLAGLIAILLVAAAVDSSSASPVLQFGIQIVAISIVPLLYVSFSPPAWLRREWRASEEQGLQAFMQDLLLLKENPEVLGDRALDWGMRLTGAAAAAIFRDDLSQVAIKGLDLEQTRELQGHMADLHEGVSRRSIGGVERTLIVLPYSRLSDAGWLVILSGPFSPSFGPDEVSRVQQFIAAVSAALDRARLMERLHDANQHLKQADEHKSTFLASMSHELRTPLNAILGFAELLIDSKDGQFPAATQKRFLEQIHSSGKHLLSLINDVLDLSKVEAGQMELRRQPIVVSSIVEQVLGTVEPLAAMKRIQLEAETTDAGEILADGGKLKQMLLNLVSNAIKFTPEAGNVKVRARRLDNAIELAVTDTGLGVAKADQGRIFEAFQQVDSGPGRHQPGTGLGLTLTRRFAHLHGGEVRIESEVGKGSTFIITLPINGLTAVAVQADSGVIPTANGRRDDPLILVVEDDPAAAELLTRILEQGGYRTAVARTGTAAVANARELQPAAITLDILLPELDGWDVLKRLKKDEWTKHIPAVVVSVVDDPELGIALGALDYFVKPVDGDALLHCLDRFRHARPGAAAAFRVLVVDDEPANREFLSRLLEPAGYNVAQASGGAQAITMAKAWRPHLVLLDLMMPEVSGFDVVEALRADATTASLPILVVTAKDLTAADKKQLNGRVSTILSRRSTGAAELLPLLRQVVSNPAVMV